MLASFNGLYYSLHICLFVCLKEFIVHYMGTKVPLKSRHCLNYWIQVNTNELHSAYKIVNTSNSNYYIEQQYRPNNPVTQNQEQCTETLFLFVAIITFPFAVAHEH